MKIKYSEPTQFQLKNVHSVLKIEQLQYNKEKAKQELLHIIDNKIQTLTLSLEVKS